MSCGTKNYVVIPCCVDTLCEHYSTVPVTLCGLCSVIKLLHCVTGSVTSCCCYTATSPGPIWVSTVSILRFLYYGFCVLYVMFATVKRVRNFCSLDIAMHSGLSSSNHLYHRSHDTTHYCKARLLFLCLFQSTFSQPTPIVIAAAYVYQHHVPLYNSGLLRARVRALH